MKRKISLLLCTAMLAGTLSGCGAAAPTAPETPAPEESQEAAGDEEISADLAKSLLEMGDSFQASMAIDDVLNTVSAGGGVYARQSAGGGNGGGFTIEDVDYVLIYNPYIYDQREKKSTTNLYTGDFSSQIAVGTNRADDFELDMSANSPAQPDAFDIETQKGGRGPGMVETFKEGEKSQFYYCSSVANNQRKKAEFKCEYVGKNCYIWSLDGSVSAKDAKLFGEEFDSTIYDNDVKAFGEARFTDDGGKVNLLFYPMDVKGICGFFTNADIFSAGEVPKQYIEENGLNTDRAIININSDMVAVLGPKEVNSTVAHEFQHLICSSNALENPTSPVVMMSTWLNESMSAYAEELNYPGIKKESDYNICMYPSTNFRKGQSLYNFSIENDEYIGAYGAVYLFEEFIRHYDGDEVLTSIHNYWRTKPSEKLTESEALIGSVSDSFKKTVDESVEYPAEISKGFKSDADEWMSKLTLDFYLETLTPDLADLKDYSMDLRNLMIYDEKGATDIEGGGRVIVATQGGSYTVPSDADSDLIYIGMDKNFNVVTDVISSYNSQAAGASAGSDSDSSYESGNSNGIQYDEDGYFKFKYNGKSQSYIITDGDIKDSALDAVAAGLEQIEGVTTKKVKTSTMADVLDQLRKLVDDGNVGFVTIILAEDNATGEEYYEYSLLCEELITKGVFVSDITNDYPETFPFPWCFVLECEGKGAKNMVEKIPEAVGEKILEVLIKVHNDGELCPFICSPS